jgi:hypothetical protein
VSKTRVKVVCEKDSVRQRSAQRFQHHQLVIHIAAEHADSLYSVFALVPKLAILLNQLCCEAAQVIGLIKSFR